MLNKETCGAEGNDEQWRADVFEPGSLKKLMKKQSQFRRNLLCKLFKCDKSQLGTLLGYPDEQRCGIYVSDKKKVDCENESTSDPAPIYTDSSIFSKVHKMMFEMVVINMKLISVFSLLPY